MGALLRTSTEEDKCEGEKFNARVLAVVGMDVVDAGLR